MPTTPRQAEQMLRMRCWKVMEPMIGTPIVIICAAFLGAGYVCPLLLLKMPILVVLLDAARWDVSGSRRKQMVRSEKLPDE